MLRFCVSVCVSVVHIYLLNFFSLTLNHWITNDDNKNNNNTLYTQSHKHMHKFLSISLRLFLMRLNILYTRRLSEMRAKRKRTDSKEPKNIFSIVFSFRQDHGCTPNDIRCVRRRNIYTLDRIWALSFVLHIYKWDLLHLIHVHFFSFTHEHTHTLTHELFIFTHSVAHFFFFKKICWIKTFKWKS